LAGSGKTGAVHLLSQLLGQELRVLSINSAMDTTEILGGFEQVGIAMSSVVCLEIYYLLIQGAYTAPTLCVLRFLQFMYLCMLLASCSHIYGLKCRGISYLQAAKLVR